jgi:hypothetical protein
MDQKIIKSYWSMRRSVRANIAMHVRDFTNAELSNCAGLTDAEVASCSTDEYAENNDHLVMDITKCQTLTECDRGSATVCDSQRQNARRKPEQLKTA